MRDIHTIVIHCSATRASANIGVDDIRKWHTDPRPQGRGWSDVGYHYVICRDGEVEEGRKLGTIPACVKGQNKHIICICLVGGLNDETGEAEDNFTEDQYDSLKRTLFTLRSRFPWAGILGHRDYSPDLDGDGKIEEQEWFKQCPCFDVKKWMLSI